MTYRFTKNQRTQGKKNLLKLALWLSKNPQRNWNMMQSSNCAMSHIPTVFPDNPKAPVGYGYYDEEDGRQGAHTFFAFTSSEEDRVLGDALFANDNTQKEQVAMMRKFARLNPGYKVS